jgi:hypothetical protein
MSIKRNVQAFREWAYENKLLKREEPTEATFIDPKLNSKARKRLRWQNRRPKEF